MKKIFIISFMMCVFAYSSAYSEIVVKSVTGDVVYKDESQWKSLNAGQVLREGTKISTGVRSSAVISIDNSMLRVQQLTMIKIFRNRTVKDSENTHIGLKYGSLNARVKRISTLKTSFKITTPVATSSVRGTEENVSYGPKTGMVIRVVEGTVAGENSDGVSEFISGNSVFRLGPGDTRPRHLLTDLRDRTLNPIIDTYITGSEKDFHDFSDDGIENHEYIYFLDTTVERGGNSNINASANIDIIWP